MKSKLIIMSIIAAAAIAAAVVCLSLIAPELPGLGNSVADYNRAATNHGLSGSYLSDNEVLLADTIHKQAGKTVVSYGIFSLAEGQKAEDFLKYKAGDAHGLMEVGAATAEFIGDDLNNIRNYKVMHNL